MLINLLQSGNLYSIGHPSITQSENLISIPFKENIKAIGIYLCHQDALESKIMKNFADILFLQN